MSSLPDLTDEQIIDAFHLLWYERRRESTWKRTAWFGAGVQQCPFDLWTFQEILADTRPEAIVELGVKRGGTTLFFANLLDLMHPGEPEAAQVVGVDVHLGAVAKETRRHPRVSLVEGSSVDAEVTGEVARLCKGRRTMVVADSDHSAPHVLEELRGYADIVSPGCYLIVSDSNINGHPASVGWGPGPYEAVDEFLRETNDFEADRDRERHMLTLSPRGFLRKRGRLDRILSR